MSDKVQFDLMKMNGGYTISCSVEDEVFTALDFEFDLESKELRVVCFVDTGKTQSRAVYLETKLSDALTELLSRMLPKIWEQYGF